MFKKTYIMFLLVAVLSSSSHGYAQQVVLSAPHSQFTEHWHENLGSSFYLEGSFPRGGWFFKWGAPVLPPFGGYDGRDTRFGIGFRKGNLRGRLNLWMSQGMDRSIIMDAPYITVPHAGYGSIRHGSWRPFVTGWTPVLGGQPQWQYPLKNFVNSADAKQLKVTSRGSRDAEQIEHVRQTLKAPQQDPPLTLINGTERSGTDQ